MRYLSLFSGVGGFESGIIQAYENMDNRGTASPSTLAVHRDKPNTNSSDGDGRGTDPVCIGYSEIDSYATKIYQKHFPNHKAYGDITKIDAEDLPEFDLLVGGFPYQSFSIAGKRGGFDDTRGTLFFDIARIAQQKQPRLLLLENVKGLLSHDKGRTFRTIISTLDELGYDLQW
jgi:DNA (cytosine-5)-methyltransferase 1